MSEPIPPPVPLRHDRERTITALCDHFAHDHLEAEELEQLIDRAHRATTLTELDALLAGLPALPQPSTGLAEYQRTGGGAAGERQLVVALMGGAERKGEWLPARNVHVVAVMGGVMLDFRHAQLDPGITEVYVFAMMGGVEIIVPPEIRVDSSGIGIMGGFEHRSRGRYPVDTSVPVLRVSGVALMGGVEVSVRQPGESARDARRRIRRERRDLRGG